MQLQHLRIKKKKKRNKMVLKIVVRSFKTKADPWCTILGLPSHRAWHWAECARGQVALCAKQPSLQLAGSRRNHSLSHISVPAKEDPKQCTKWGPWHSPHSHSFLLLCVDNYGEASILLKHTVNTSWRKVFLFWQQLKPSGLSSHFCPDPQ